MARIDTNDINNDINNDVTNAATNAAASVQIRLTGRVRHQNSYRTQMNQRIRRLLVTLSAGAVIAGCANAPASQSGSTSDHGALSGAWRSKISFHTGTFAPVKDLEFLYSYNVGGTMTESSNYDEAANSTPPAYGIWKQTGPGKFETKYLFYMTQAPDTHAGQPAGDDWWPAGHGELTETIVLSADGKTYTSTIKFAAFDKTDKVVASDGGEGTGSATRIDF